MKNITLIIITLLLISCNFEQNKKNIEINDAKIEKQTVSKFEIIVYTKYDIPLNIDIINYLFENNCSYNSDFLNPASNKNQYCTDISKAINLGIYTTDLTYCTIYNISQNSLDYFSTNKFLSYELGISNGYDETYYNRLEKNISNSDSLRNIAEESYWQACNFLSEKNMNNILPFMVYGGWLETMNIMILHEINTPKNTRIKEQILAQETTVIKLINYMYNIMIESSAYYYISDIRVIIEELEIINELYSKYEKSNNNIIYTSIKTKLIEIRNQKTNKI